MASLELRNDNDRSPFEQLLVVEDDHVRFAIWERLSSKEKNVLDVRTGFQATGERDELEEVHCVTQPVRTRFDNFAGDGHASSLNLFRVNRKDRRLEILRVRFREFVL